jgi:hypothetical protein
MFLAAVTTLALESGSISLKVIQKTEWKKMTDCWFLYIVMNDMNVPFMVGWIPQYYLDLAIEDPQPSFVVLMP